jgi:hypothetical protein
MFSYTESEFLIFVKRYFEYIFGFGILLLAIAKMYLNKSFNRILSVLLLIINKKKIENHEFFKLSFSLYEDESFSNIISIGKKLLIQDVARIEFKYLKFTVINTLKFIYANKFTNTYILHSVIETELKEYRDLRNTKLRKKFPAKFVELYIQTTDIYYHYINSYFKAMLKERSIYQLILRMLDIYFAFLVTYKQTIPYRVNRMNGQLSGIIYKGYEL